MIAVQGAQFFDVQHRCMYFFHANDGFLHTFPDCKRDFRDIFERCLQRLSLFVHIARHRSDLLSDIVNFADGLQNFRRTGRLFGDRAEYGILKLRNIRYSRIHAVEAFSGAVGCRNYAVYDGTYALEVAGYSL